MRKVLLLLALAGPLTAQGTPDPNLEITSGVMPVMSRTTASTWTKPFLAPANAPRVSSHKPMHKLPEGPPSYELRNPPMAPIPTSGKGAGISAAPIKLQRNTQPTWPGQRRVTESEPAVAQWGNNVLFTHNVDAATSTNGGLTWTRRDPRNFGSLDGGFCCDQVALKTPAGATEQVAWLMQYRYGSATNQGRYRIAIFSTQARLGAGQSWSYSWGPGSFGWPAGYWMDYPSISASKNNLFVTANVYRGATTGPNLWGVVCWRMNLADMKAGKSVRFRAARLVNRGQSWRLAAGSEAVDSAYWLFPRTTTSAYVYRWKDSDAAPTRKLITIAAYSGGTNFVFRSRDGRNVMGKSDSRGLCGYVGKGRVGFFWNANVRTGRPVPYIRGLEVDATTLNKKREYDWWTATQLWAYPSVAMNARGDIAGSFTICNSTGFPNSVVYVSDDLGTFDALAVGGSRGGPANNTWGDYVVAQQHPTRQNTWIATNMDMNSTAGRGGNQQPRFTWFGRDRDMAGRADLVASELTASTTTLKPRSRVTLTGKVENLGDATTPITTATFRLSTNSIISGGDRLLASQSIPGLARNGARRWSQSVVVPARSSAAGDCWIGLIADDGRNVTESRENNNTKALKVRCLQSLSDLTVTSVTGTGGTGGGFGSCAVTVKNAGSGPAGAFTTAIMLSTNNFISAADELVGSVRVASLAANASTTLRRSYRIPRCYSARTGYVGAIADSMGEVPEDNEGNNARATASAVTIIPYSGAGRYLEWRSRVGGVASATTGTGVFKLVAGPRRGDMCAIAPRNVGDWCLGLWSGSSVFRIDALTNISLGLINGPLLPRHLSRIGTSGRVYPSVSLPNQAGIRPFTVYTHTVWFSGDFKTFRGLGSNSLRMTIGS